MLTRSLTGSGRTLGRRRPERHRYAPRGSLRSRCETPGPRSARSAHMKITRLSISTALPFVATALAFASIPVFASAVAPARATPLVSELVLRDLLLKPSGIVFGMHPTKARVVLTAAAAVPLKVCQFGTTFSTYWEGGCRRLVGRPLALPTSGGAVHIGFRVLPSGGRTTRVAALDVRWHCVDHYFAVLRGETVVRRPRPIFDC
jgi:hypothetical protein